MNPCRVVIFDWDGTLVDSAAHIVRCVQAAAADAGLDVPAADKVRHVIGLSLERAFMSIVPGARQDAFGSFVAAYREHFFRATGEVQPLFPGVADVLAELREQGLFLAVATGKGRNGLRRGLEETGLKRFFDVTRCAEDTASKPDPQMLREILDDLGLEPGEGLMIGDTSYDLEMAARIGMPSIGVTYGAHAREHLEPHRPLGLLDDIRALPAYLSGAVQRTG